MEGDKVVDPGVPRLPPGAFWGERRAFQEAPGGNPGTRGTKTTPPAMPHDGRRFLGSPPHRMARGKSCYPESPGSRRGLFAGSDAHFKKPRVETRGHEVRKPPRRPRRTTARVIVAPEFRFLALEASGASLQACECGSWSHRPDSTVRDRRYRGRQSETAAPDVTVGWAPARASGTAAAPAPASA